MFQEFTITDRLLSVATLLSLLFPEAPYFQVGKADAPLSGLWVISILGFGIFKTE